MKLYRIEASETDWDEYYSIVVVAENKERAMEIAKKGNPWSIELPIQDFVEERYFFFTKEQYPLKVTEIDLNHEKVIESTMRGS